MGLLGLSLLHGLTLLDLPGLRLVPLRGHLLLLWIVLLHLHLGVASRWRLESSRWGLILDSHSTLCRCGSENLALLLRNLLRWLCRKSLLWLSNRRHLRGRLGGVLHLLRRRLRVREHRLHGLHLRRRWLLRLALHSSAALILR